MIGLLLVCLLQVIFLVILYYLIVSFFKAAPFVPTKTRLIHQILSVAHLKPGQKFLDLGSGDGRIARIAAQDFKVYATGVEFNRPLVYLSRLLGHRPNLQYICGDIWTTDISAFDVIYCYLSPTAMSRLQSKFISQTKQGTLIISRSFSIPDWQDHLIQTLPDPSGTVYYYRH